MYEPYQTLKQIARNNNLEYFLFGTYYYDDERYCVVDSEPIQINYGAWPTYTNSNSELCVRSKTQYGHIPMIDFKTPDLSKVIYCMSNLESKFGGKIDIDGHIYLSGNSYHFYGNKIMDQEEWIYFLGELLLYDEFKEVIDIRWIGHSLKSGMCALRVSNNTKPQIKYVKQFSSFF